MMNKNPISSTSQKDNTFEHVFYEMHMYYLSYEALKEMTVIDESNCPNRQFWINVLLESHATHLRNLIHFFCQHDSLNVKTVLLNEPKLGIKNHSKKIDIINKALSHLTLERADVTKNLNEMMSNLINNMFPEICDKTEKYLNYLSTASVIKSEYLQEFEDPKIHNYYLQLISIYSNKNQPNCES